MGLTTSASKSKALAIDLDIISELASVFLVLWCSCVIASTWTSEFVRVLQARVGQGRVAFVSCRRVPLSRLSSQCYSHLLERENSVFFFRLFLSRGARLGQSQGQSISFRASPESSHSLSASLSSELTAKSSACQKPITGRTEFDRSSNSCILLLKKSSRKSHWSTCFLATRLCDAAVEFTLLSVSVSVLYHSNSSISHELGMCFLTAFSTANLLIEPYAFDVSPCINTLFVLFFRIFLTAQIIASAPSLTLNPT